MSSYSQHGDGEGSLCVAVSGWKVVGAFKLRMWRHMLAEGGRYFLLFSTFEWPRSGGRTEVSMK